MIVFHGPLLVEQFYSPSAARNARLARTSRVSTPETRRVEHGSGLGVAEPFLIGEHDRGALARRQGVDRGGEPAVALACFKGGDRVGRGVGRIAGDAERQIGRTAPGIEAEIDDDPIEPGAERRFRPPARRVAPDPQQGVLHDLFGEGLAAEDAAREAERIGGVAAHQR